MRLIAAFVVLVVLVPTSLDAQANARSPPPETYSFLVVPSAGLRTYDRRAQWFPRRPLVCPKRGRVDDDGTVELFFARDGHCHGVGT